MATFYKYKEREDISKSMIDWSGLTKEISDNLIKEKNRRDNLKLELEQDQLEKLKALDEYTKGLDATMNQAMLEVAQNYKDYLLLSHRNMKNGLISVNDTKIRKQGAMDTFNAINDVTKTYNEKMSAFMEKGGNINDFIAANTARVLDISKSQLVIDDMGRGTFVTTDENGNEVVMPATAFNTVLNDQYERFDTATQVESVVDGLATWTLTSKGGYKSVSDFRQKDGENYKKTIMSKVDSILNNDKTIVSAAADMLDMRPTTDKELAQSNPDKYFLAEYKNGKIVFDAAGVKEKVKEGLYKNIDASVDRIEEQTPYKPSAAETSARIGKQEKQQTFKLITDALKGDQTALQSLVNEKELGIVSIENVAGGYNLVTSDGVTSFIDTSGNVRESGSTFAAAVGLGGEEYRNFEKSTDRVSPKFSSNVSGVVFRKSAPKIVKLNTKENISELNNSLSLDIRGNKIERTDLSSKSKSFSKKLQEIAGPYNIETSVNNNGDVIIDGETISKGIDDPTKVLNIIDQKINQSPPKVDAFGNPI